MYEGKSVIKLNFSDEELFVKFSHNFTESVTEFRFSINALLVIDNITVDGQTVLWSKEREWEPIYKANSQEIIISSEGGFSNVTITYHGKISGWCNIIELNRKALSYYSCWYPQECNIPMPEPLIYVHNAKDYIVLNAEFNEGENVWVYGGMGYDVGNIIALKNNHYFHVHDHNFDFYYLAEEEQAAVEYLLYHYHRVCNFYQNHLYSYRPLEKLCVVSLYMPEASGAYFRKDMIVLSKIFSDWCTLENIDESIGAQLAHEIAHNWCRGAAWNSWEDWLNETTAEWPSLMYALEEKNERLFAYILNKRDRLETYSTFPPIKTDDETRPDGVHERGTVLFYEIYKIYGPAIMKDMLIAFVTLECKTTSEYIAQLNNVGLKEIAISIEKGIHMQSYEGLFQ